MKIKRITDRSFFERDNVTQVATDLVGCVLVRRLGKEILKMIITETEAYQGFDDLASHAANGRRTPRTDVFFKAGGHTYVYLCYGIHYLFNVITNRESIPDAVLIRGGIFLNKHNPQIVSGPGRFTRFLSIDKSHNSIDLVTSNEIWLEERIIHTILISTAPRVGVEYVGADALRPWRYIADIPKILSEMQNLKEDSHFVSSII